MTVLPNAVLPDRPGDLPPKFSLGQLAITPGAMAHLEMAGVSVFSLLARHVVGDGGDICDEDRRANEAALIHGYRVMSVYPVDDAPVWCITEADRSVTTLLMPWEY